MIDSIIRYLSPSLALKRAQARNELHALERSDAYAAAQTNRLTGTWSPSNPNVNYAISSSIGTIRPRMRELVRNFPPFIRATNRAVDFTVGAQITFQSKAETPSGDIDEKAVKQIEYAFNRWAEKADVSGKMHLYELQRLAKRSDIVDGEFLLVKRYVDDPKRFLPFAWQIYETDWLTTQNDNDTNIQQGIQYDPNTYEVTHYHMQNPDSWYSNDIQVIPADQVVHGFKMERPGQLRGITPFVGAMSIANDLSDYVQSKIDKAKMAAKWLFIVKKAAPNSFSQTRGAEEGDPIYDVENCVIQKLNSGEEVTLGADPTNIDIEPMTRFIFQLISIVTDIPFEILTGDYREMNFTTLKASNNHFEFALEPVKARFIRQFCNPITQPFFDVAQYNGKLKLPGYWQDPYRYKKSQWQPPRMPATDPLKEAKAAADSMASKITSPQHHILRDGRDPEAVLRDWKQWDGWLKAYNITPEEISTAIANNPAAIEEQGV